MKRRDFLGLLGTAAAATATGCNRLEALGAPRRRPNIIFMVIDDQEYQDLGCYGGAALTPNIDRLAANGVRLDACYATSPVCTPSRYSCLTGRWASRSRSPLFMTHNPAGQQSYVHWNATLESDGPNLARSLQAAGYATGLAGKWHLGSDETSIVGGFMANNRRFAKLPVQPGHERPSFADPAVQEALRSNDAVMRQLVARCGFDWVEGLYWDNPEAFEVDGLDHNMEWLTRAALDFIDDNRERPFFLYFSTTAPHGPWNDLRQMDPLATPAGRLQTVPDAGMPTRASVYQRLNAAGLDTADHIKAHNTWLDDSVGAITARLQKLGLERDTLIVYFSDNARREKGFLYEGGPRVPAFMHWPAGLPGGVVCPQVVGNIDFAPTILAAAGVPPAQPLDGQNLLPLLGGQRDDWRQELVLEMGAVRAVVSRDWKYMVFSEPPDIDQRVSEHRAWNKGQGGFLWIQSTLEKEHPAYWEPRQLYDLRHDPAERVNKVQDPACATVLAAKQACLEAWVTDLGRPFAGLGGL